MTTEDLIAYHARQLEKRDDEIATLRSKVKKFREDAANKMAHEYRGKTTPHPVAPGVLVLVRNSRIEMEHSRKPKPRWLGPFVVIRRHERGSYILSELDSSILVDRIAASRIKLYYPRVGHMIDMRSIVDNVPTWVWERANGEQKKVDKTEWVDGASDDEDDDGDWL